MSASVNRSVNRETHEIMHKSHVLKSVGTLKMAHRGHHQSHQKLSLCARHGQSCIPTTTVITWKLMRQFYSCFMVYLYVMYNCHICCRARSSTKRIATLIVLQFGLHVTTSIVQVWYFRDLWEEDRSKAVMPILTEVISLPISHTVHHKGCLFSGQSSSRSNCSSLDGDNWACCILKCADPQRSILAISCEQSVVALPLPKSQPKVGPYSSCIW